MRRHAGAVVLITGAAGTIGSAIARAFAAQGAHLALLDGDGPRLETLVSQLSQNAPHQLTHAGVEDLSSEEGVRSGIESVLRHFDDRVDLLVASGEALISKRVEEATSADWQRAFALNLYSSLFACQQVIARMRRQGGGTIIFIGSDQALQPDAGLAPYALAKAALHALVKVLACELLPANICVSAVAPAATAAPLVHTLLQGYPEERYLDRATAIHLDLLHRAVHLARLLLPEEVAQAVLFLASSPVYNGTILNASGGTVRSIAS